MAELENFILQKENLDMPKDAYLAITNTTVIDGTGNDPLPHRTILIKNNKIESIAPRNDIEIPEGAKDIDGRGKFVLPGFIDAHIHLTYPYSMESILFDTNSLATVRALHLMRKYRKAGVTTVRDVGSHAEAMHAIMLGKKSGWLDTIRLFPCGQVLTTTGGHGDGLDAATAVDGPWAFRKAIREMHKKGFRFIKVTPPFTVEEIEAAVDEAHTRLMRITCHHGIATDLADGSVMIWRAIDAGVDCIEHTSPLSDELLQIIAEKKIHMVPTMHVMDILYHDPKRAPRYDPKVWNMSVHEKIFKKARDLGIVLGVGTDAIFEMLPQYPDFYFEELKTFVRFGMSPQEAIMAATKNNAIILGKDKELGTLEAGKLADLQIFPENPLDNLDILGKPETVIIDGKISFLN